MSIALDRFPEASKEWISDKAETQVALLQEIIVAARNIRAEIKLDSKRRVSADFSTPDPSIRNLVAANLGFLLRLASLSSVNFHSGHLDPAGGAVRSTAQFDLRIAFTEGVDIQTEVAKLRKEIERLQADIESKQMRLTDETFRSRAPQHIVRGLESTLAERALEHEKLTRRLAQLEGPLGSADGS
jgi:valyl-tRNA synthetase